MAGISVDISGDAASVIRALDKVSRQLDKTAAGMGKNAKASKRAEKGTKDAFGSKALNSITSYATGLAGVGGIAAAYKAIQAEMQNTIDLQKEFNTEQVTLAAAQDMITRNFSGTKEELLDIFKVGKDISKETGVGENIIDKAIAEGLTASAGNVEGTQDAVRVAAEFLGSAADQIPGFVGSMLDLQKVTGSADVIENFGLLAQTGKMSRITTPDLQAKNIAPALVGAQGAGATSQEGAALFAALTTAASDRTGERTGTALISLGEQLKEFFTEGKGKRTESEAGGLTFGGRVKALQADQGLAEKFLGGASFEKKAIAPVTGLLTDQESVAATAFDQFLGEMGTSADLVATGNEALTKMLTSEVQKNAASQRSQETLLQQGKTIDTEASQKSTARASITEALRIAGVGALGQKVAGFALKQRETFGGDVREFAPDVIRDQATALEEGRSGSRGTGLFGGGAREANDVDKEQAVLLRAIADGIEEQNKARKSAAEGKGDVVPNKQPVARNVGQE